MKKYPRVCLWGLCGIFMLHNFILPPFIEPGLAFREAQASEDIGLVDTLIGSTFKTLAKTFVFAVNLDKLKQDNIERLKKMKEEKFQRQYLLVHSVLKDCPFFEAQYGLNAEMTRDRAIKNIESLDKKKIYEIIEAVPNALIASQFKLYLQQTKQKIQNSDLAVQIHQLWEKITRQAYTKQENRLRR